LGWYRIGIIACLLAGASLRFCGLERGLSDFAPHAPQDSATASAFYAFHPDEFMVIRSSLSPIDPFAPPFTVYGLLPVYALRGALLAAGVGPSALETPAGNHRVYLTARLLAAFYSMASLVLVWLLGRRYFTRSATLLALFIMAFAPGAVQQAHFYIVDGAFLMLSLAAIYVGARAVEQASTKMWYLGAGALIGCAGATRLNGLLLGLILVALYASKNSWRPPRLVRSRELWLAAGCALAAVLMINPYILSNPLLMQQAKGYQDFGLALRVGSGDILQIWTLFDYHSIPYITVLTQLLPPSIGWPLTLLTPLAMGYAFWHGTWPTRALLLWCGIHLFLIGGLKMQHVRYVVPLLPFLALSIGVLWDSLWRRAKSVSLRWALVCLLSFTAGHLGLYGVAFAQIYTQEDSRIQAAKFLYEQATPSSIIGVENGAFSMRPFIGSTYHPVVLGASSLFYRAPYMLCATQVDLLRSRVRQMDYLLIVDVNHAAQFTAVPMLFPVAADFYDKLRDNQLGFTQIRRFKEYPYTLGFEFEDDGFEPSFLGYDHPAVLVFKSEGGEVVERVMNQWRDAMNNDTRCADASLSEVAQNLKRGDLEQATKTVESLIERLPYAKLAYPLAAEIYRQQGRIAKAEATYDLYRPVSAHGVMAHVNSGNAELQAPISVALSYVQLGLSELAIKVLRRATAEDAPASRRESLQMADLYTVFAEQKLGDNATLKKELLELAISLAPYEKAYNGLAALASDQGDGERAIQLWQQSLSLNPDQAEVYAELCRKLAQTADQRELALYYFEQTLRLQPKLAAELKKWLIQNGAWH